MYIFSAYICNCIYIRTTLYCKNYKFVEAFWGTPENCMKAILAHAFALFSSCRAPLNKNSTWLNAESRGAFNYVEFFCSGTLSPEQYSIQIVVPGCAEQYSTPRIMSPDPAES